MLENTLTVGRIAEGFVLDHIEAGKSMEIYKYLHLDKLDCCVAIIKNAKSNKMGKKDIIKIEGPITVDLDLLAVLDGDITLNFIENDVIVRKGHPKLPEKVTGIIKCKNPRCVTSSATERGLMHTFKLTDPVNRIYRCVYCEQKFKGHL